MFKEFLIDLSSEPTVMLCNFSMASVSSVNIKVVPGIVVIVSLNNKKTATTDQKPPF